MRGGEIKEGAGAVIIPCVRLQAALGKMECDVEEVQIEASKKHALTGKANGMRFELLGLDAKEFPAVKPITEAVEQQFAEGVLASAFERELGAASSDETRYVLCRSFTSRRPMARCGWWRPMVGGWRSPSSALTRAMAKAWT